MAPSKLKPLDHDLPSDLSDAAAFSPDYDATGNIVPPDDLVEEGNPAVPTRAELEDLIRFRTQQATKGLPTPDVLPKAPGARAPQRDLPKVSGGKALVYGFGQGASAGLQDEAAGKVVEFNSLTNTANGVKPGPAWDPDLVPPPDPIAISKYLGNRATQRVRDLQDASHEQHPFAAGAGQLLGQAGTDSVFGLFGVNALSPAYQAGSGFAQGFGNTDVDKESGAGLARSLTIGGANALVGYLGGKYLAPVMGHTVGAPGRAVESRATSTIEELLSPLKSDINAKNAVIETDRQAVLDRVKKTLFRHDELLTEEEQGVHREVVKELEKRGMDEAAARQKSFELILKRRELEERKAKETVFRMMERRAQAGQEAHDAAHTAADQQTRSVRMQAFKDLRGERVAHNEQVLGDYETQVKQATKDAQRTTSQQTAAKNSAEDVALKSVQGEQARAAADEVAVRKRALQQLRQRIQTGGGKPDEIASKLAQLDKLESELEASAHGKIGQAYQTKYQAEHVYGDGVPDSALTPEQLAKRNAYKAKMEDVAKRHLDEPLPEERINAETAAERERIAAERKALQDHQANPPSEADLTDAAVAQLTKKVDPAAVNAVTEAELVEQRLHKIIPPDAPKTSLPQQMSVAQERMSPEWLRANGHPEIARALEAQPTTFPLAQRPGLVSQSIPKEELDAKAAGEIAELEKHGLARTRPEGAPAPFDIQAEDFQRFLSNRLALRRKAGLYPDLPPRPEMPTHIPLDPDEVARIAKARLESRRAANPLLRDDRALGDQRLSPAWLREHGEFDLATKLEKPTEKIPMPANDALAQKLRKTPANAGEVVSDIVGALPGMRKLPFIKRLMSKNITPYDQYLLSRRNQTVGKFMATTVPDRMALLGIRAGQQKANAALEDSDMYRDFMAWMAARDADRTK